MTRRLVFILAVLVSPVSGCGETPFPLESDIDALEWGWVDFHSDACLDCLCDTGCGQTRITLTQIHDKPITVDMPNGHDRDHICIDGYPVGNEFEPREMRPSQRLILDVSVCGYLPGELNLEDQDPPLPIEGRLVFSSDSETEQLEIPWSFIPYRIQGGLDTGR